jgi:hypothetical protein
VEVLGILSRCQSLRDLERFAERHHGVLSEALGIELRRHPSDSAFRYAFHQVDVAALCAAIPATGHSPRFQVAQWISISWCVTTRRGATRSNPLLAVVPRSMTRCRSTAQRWAWRTASQKPDGYSQACYATGDNHEWAVLRQLLGELELEGVLLQAAGTAFSEGVALHMRRPLFNSSRSRGPTSC